MVIERALPDRSSRIGVLTLALLAMGRATAFAQEAPAQPIVEHSPSLSEARAAARALAEHGFALLQEGDFVGAIPPLEQAEAKFHAPPHLLYLARAHVGLGHLARARAIYQQIVGEELASYAPDAFRAAQTVARTELAALLPKVPSLEVVAPDGWQVTVDGIRVGAAELKRPIPLDPGDHMVRASASEVPDFIRSVHLEPGARAMVEIVATLIAPPTVTVRPLVAVPEPSPIPPPARAPWRSLAPAITAFGAGAVGVGVGSAAGVISISKVGELSRRCPNHHCNTADQPIADSAKTMGNVSTIAFAAGGAGVAVGVVLLLVLGSRSSERRTSGAPPGFATRDVRAHVEPTIGVGSVGLRGSF